MYKYTVGVEGMKCPMCEKHLTEELKTLGSLKHLTVSFEKNQAAFSSETFYEQDVVFALVVKAGYKPISWNVEKTKGFLLFG